MTAPAGRLDETCRRAATIRGILCMLGSGVLLTCNDASMKAVSKGIPLGEMLFVRGGAALLLVLAYAAATGQFGRLRVTRPGGQTVRGLLMIVGTFMFIGGIRQMPLADAIAVAYIGPVLVTALAPAMLGEHVGWRRWCAVLAGFAGVVVMLRPTGDAFHWAILLPFGAACTGAFRDIITRRLSTGDSTLATLMVTTAAVALGGLVTLPLGWQAIPIADLSLLLLAAVLLCVAHYLMIEAFRLAEAAAVVPFKYLSLVWAMLIGFLLWGDVPDGFTFAGGGLVIGAGLYILHRERKLSH